MFVEREILLFFPSDRIPSDLLAGYKGQAAVTHCAFLCVSWLGWIKLCFNTELEWSQREEQQTAEWSNLSFNLIHIGVISLLCFGNPMGWRRKRAFQQCFATLESRDSKSLLIRPLPSFSYPLSAKALAHNIASVQLPSKLSVASFIISNCQSALRLAAKASCCSS